MISNLLPLASIALKLGSQLLGSSSKPEPVQQTVQEERLAPTVQSLFQRLGIKDADSEQNRSAINHFMGGADADLGAGEWWPIPPSCHRERPQPAGERHPEHPPQCAAK